MPYSSTLEPAAPETVTLEVTESIIPQSTMSETAAVEVSDSCLPKPAASAIVREEATYSHHILFGRPVPCGKKVRFYYMIRHWKMYSNHA